MAKLQAKIGESRMDLIRRAKPGDTLVFGNECLEKKHHCFDLQVGHNCFNCCYCNLPNATDRQFQSELTADFERVHGKKFVIIPAKAQPVYEKTADIKKAERARILKWIYNQENHAMGMASDFDTESIVVDLESLERAINL